MWKELMILPEIFFEIHIYFKFKCFSPSMNYELVFSLRYPKLDRQFFFFLLVNILGILFS